MSKLNIDQRTILSLFSDKRSDFLIPDYQRPYKWEEDELNTLWEDLVDFAIPGEDTDAFNDNDEYFLGPIVTFKNSENKLEIIDGQQRLTTLMLLLRAFYARFEHMQDQRSQKTRSDIAACIWKTDEFGEPHLEELKIDSDVASDDDKEEFLEILKTGIVKPEYESRYAKAFSFFEKRIDEFATRYFSYPPYLATRLLKNLILLPIEAESQTTALRIFSTLNDRGLPLSDADIFKSQFYKYFGEKGAVEKEEFIERWRRLEDTSKKVFGGSNPLNELFTRYMYYQRAKQGIKDSTTISLRDFYEKESYKLLKSEQTLSDLESLLDFWERVHFQEPLSPDNPKGFSDEALRKLFVLRFAPNGMWANFVSVYFLHHRNSQGLLEDEQSFCKFLALITGFIWTYTVVRPGVHALRTPIYQEMVHLVNGEKVAFENFRFSRAELEEQLSRYRFSNNRRITKPMLLWWAFQNPNQVLIDPDKKIEIEHIFAKRRENELSNAALLDAIGNKAFLEKSINIRASDYRFTDKVSYYKYGSSKTQKSPNRGTKNSELLEIVRTHTDFTESDIQKRTDQIINEFVSYLDSCGLIQQN